MTNQLTLWPAVRPADRLRWSMTRGKRFQECARKYYLYHYAGAGGSRPDASAATRDIYVLKHLRNRYMWVGEIVHELIEMCLQRWRGGQEVTLDSLLQRGTWRMRAQYAESLRGVYRQRPTQACGLVEHEYAEPITREEWQAQGHRMERCLRNFFALEITRVIRATPPWSWLALETAGSFELDGATIVVKPDFAWRTPTGQVMLVDWKTGQPRDDERLQLAVYGIFAQRVWGLAATDVHAQLVYLDSGRVDAFDLGPGDLRRAGADISASLTQIRGLVHQGVPNAADFPRTTALSACARCAFRRVCGRTAPIALPEEKATGRPASC